MRVLIIPAIIITLLLMPHASYAQTCPEGTCNPPNDCSGCADCIGTAPDADPITYCHFCNVSGVTVTITSPGGSPRPYDLVPVSGDPVCNPGDPETWKKAWETPESSRYDFCPEAGAYSAVFSFLSQEGDETYQYELSEPETIYYVDYDTEEWCNCGYPGNWDIGGDSPPNTCCKNVAGEYARICEDGGMGICSASTDNLACCNNPNDCVYDGDCYSEGSTVLGTVCSLGGWGDIGPPVVGISVSPQSVISEWQNTDATASITCDDAGIACDTDSYRFYITDSQIASCPVDYDQYTLPDPQTMDARAWACGAAKDTQGNTEFYGPVSFLVDKTIPTITDSYGLNDGVWVFDDQTIDFYPTDYGSVWGLEGLGGSPGDYGSVASLSSSPEAYKGRLSFSAMVGVVPYPPEVTTVWQAACASATVSCSGVTGDCVTNSYRIYVSDSEITECPTDYAEYIFSSPHIITEHSWVCAAAMDDTGEFSYSSPLEFLVDLGLYPIESGIDEVRYCTVPNGDPACVPNSVISGPLYELAFTQSMDMDLYYVTDDNAGNPSATGSFNIKINKNDPPAVAVTGAPPDWTNQDQTADMTCFDHFTDAGCTDTGTYGMIVYDYDPGTCPQDDTVYADNPPQAITGESWVCAAAKASGIWGFSTPAWFTIEKEMPTVSLQGMPGWTNSTDELTYFTAVWSASDTGGSGIESIGLQYRIFDRESDTYITSWNDWEPFPSGSGYRDFGPLDPVDPGSYNNHTFFLRASIIDRAGNSLPYSDVGPYVNTSIDIQAPACIAGDLDGYYPRSDIEVTFDSLEGESGMETFEFQIRGPDGGAWRDPLDPSTLACINSTPVDNADSVKLECMLSDEGLWEFRARARDIAGNTGSWSSIESTTIDLTPPGLLVTEPDYTWTKGDSITIRWVNSDPETDHFDVHYYNTTWPSGHPADSDWRYFGSYDPPTAFTTMGQGGSPLFELLEGDIYYINVTAYDPAGNQFSRIKNVTIDRTAPLVYVVPRDQNGAEIDSEIIQPDRGITLINITSRVYDGLSGVKSNELEYTIYGEALRQEVLDCGPGPSAGYSVCSTADDSITPARTDIPFGDTTSIRYRAVAKDRAGNVNMTQYYFSVAHPLANFGSSGYFLALGETRLIPVMIRNVRDYEDDVTVNLTLYQFARFEQSCDPADCDIAPDKRSITAFSLDPYEERIYYVMLLSSEPGEYKLNLTARSSVDPLLTDNHEAGIMTSYPIYFPGLDGWAIIVLMVLAVLGFSLFSRIDI